MSKKTESAAPVGSKELFGNQHRLDKIIMPILEYADTIAAAEPNRAAKIRHIAGECRVELAQLEAALIRLGLHD